jgi:serine/threonine protein kinase
MEKCRDSLYNYMADTPDLTEESLGKLVYQMLAALSHLHSYRLVHRDVKPDNFLVGGADGSTVKLCDFGHAAFLPKEGKLCEPVGTYGFMCPQMLRGELYDAKADIWSLGVTVYVLLFGTFPYAFNKPPRFKAADEMQEPCSTDASSFVRELLQPDDEHRPSASEALDLPYMTTIGTPRDMNSEALPSLHPMLELAQQAGAIAPHDIYRKTALDDSMSKVQFDKLGVRMPDAWKTHQISMERVSFSSKGCEVSPTSTIDDGESVPSPKRSRNSWSRTFSSLSSKSSL